jgi:hypothetical protein
VGHQSDSQSGRMGQCRWYARLRGVRGYSNAVVSARGRSCTYSAGVGLDANGVTSTSVGAGASGTALCAGPASSVC